MASCGWHPEVGGASVEDDSEVLWWRPQPNFPIILGLMAKQERVSEELDRSPGGQGLQGATTHIHVVGEGHEDGLVPRG